MKKSLIIFFKKMFLNFGIDFINFYNPHTLGWMLTRHKIEGTTLKNLLYISNKENSHIFGRC